MNLQRNISATTSRGDTRGLTAVELAIAVAILAFLVTLSLLLLRRQRHEELQARADAAPADVFEITLMPERESYTVGEPLAFLCDVCNPTDFPLDFTWEGWKLTYFGIYPKPGWPGTTLITGPRSIFERSEYSSGTELITWDEALPNYRIDAGDTLRFKFHYAGSRVEGAAIPSNGIGVTSWLHRASTWRVGEPLEENTILTRFTLFPGAESEATEHDAS